MGGKTAFHKLIRRAFDTKKFHIFFSSYMKYIPHLKNSRRKGFRENIIALSLLFVTVILKSLLQTWYGIIPFLIVEQIVFYES